MKTPTSLLSVNIVKFIRMIKIGKHTIYNHENSYTSIEKCTKFVVISHSILINKLKVFVSLNLKILIWIKEKSIFTNIGAEM